MASTILRYATDNDDTTLNVADTTGFAVNGGIVTINSEQILYVTASDNQLISCTRGYNSTVAASHVVNSTVTFNSPTPHPAPDDGVTSLQADSNPIITGPVELVSGNNVTLSQTGQNITVNSTSSGGITQLTGDVTAGPGSGSQPSTLATVNSNVGSFTSANITVNAKGLITSAANGSGGSSPNVVQFVDTTGLSTNSATPVATPTTVTITPSSSSAKIKITVSGSMRSTVASASGVNVYLYRNGSQIGNRQDYFFINISSDTQIPSSFSYLDSPGSTSAQTYTVYIANDDGSTNVFWYAGAANARIIAQEVH